METVEKGKRVLGIELATDPRWVNLAEFDLEEILSDHAYCEQKATTSCISLIQRYPEYVELVQELMPIVTEEWGHFRLVVAEMTKRGMKLGRQRKDQYVNRLRDFMKRANNREEKLLHELIIFAMIEARSCERFRLLSLHISEDELKEFYHRFMVSEAGHYKLFLKLAKQYFTEELAQETWKEMLAFESELLGDMELRGDRMH
jgi:tRNA-(ms[2]io[6]A)-hydroxylase